MAKKSISAPLRKKVLARDNHICRACGFGGTVAHAPYLDCDHAISEKNGGETSLDNLQTLCKHCNGEKGEANWTFNIRTASVADEIWAHNHKVMSAAFHADTARRLRKLK
jgi:hypothetical protein